MKKVLVLAAVLFSLTHAHALTIGTDAQYTQGGSVVVSDPKTGPPPGTLVSQALVPSSDGTGLGFSGPGFAKAANFSGITAVKAEALFFSGQGVDHTVHAQATFSETVTNGEGGARDFFYNFKVVAPNLLLVDFAGASPGQPGAPTATYNVEVKVDGNTLFNSAATFNGGINGVVLTKTGVDFGSTITGMNGDSIREAQFNDHSGNLFLGNFAKNDSFIFETLIEVSVSAFGFELGGQAFVGDPGDIGVDSPGLSGVIVVPEPMSATFTLVWIGCAGHDASAALCSVSRYPPSSLATPGVPSFKRLYTAGHWGRL